MNYELRARTSIRTGAAVERDIYTPSRLNREARALLEGNLPALWLEGEVSNFSRPASGHWYFSLKDASAQLRCAMFRQRNMLATFTPKDGTQVLVRGRVSLYEPRGDYQFLADYIELGGEGALRRQFDALKAKLAAAGLFAPQRKRVLPKMPRRIGIVTSPTGAAIRDILNILRRRFPLIPVMIHPVPVQGAGAAEKIAEAIAFVSRHCECDVLIVARGGGSLEDLWAFNEEIVAYAIFNCTIPVVTGIGHEIDFTIADFVADLRAPTPSGAAELVVPDCAEWIRALTSWDIRLGRALQRSLSTHTQRALWLNRRLAQLHPGIQLRQRAQRVDELETQLRRCFRHQFESRRSALGEQIAHLRRVSPRVKLALAGGRLDALSGILPALMQRQLEKRQESFASAARTLHAVSPLATLNRGYAIVTDASGKVVSDASMLAAGAAIEARLANGKVRARVDAVMPAADAADGSADGE